MTRRGTTWAGRRGFTLIELLVVVGVIVALLALGLTAGTAARASAKRSAGERLLQAVAQGLEQFKADHGYYPPLLNPDPAGVLPGALVSESLPDAFLGSGPDPVLRANYRSDISLSAYLMGIGDLNGDRKQEYNISSGEPNLDDGVNGPGIRAPGPDKSWGGARLRAAGLPTVATDPPIPPQDGTVFGPYFNVSNTKSLKRMTASDELADPLHRLEGMALITDGWGNAIRYYRHLPTGFAQEPTLEDVPAELLSPDAAVVFANPNRPSSQPVPATVDSPLLHAEFVLLSAGPDGRFGDRETETANVDPQTPRFLTAGGATGIGAGGPLAPDVSARIVRRISDNMRFIP